MILTTHVNANTHLYGKRLSRWRCRAAILLLPTLMLVSSDTRAGGDPVTWNAGDGYWDVAANWSTDQLPDSTDDVENDTSGTITFSNISALVNSFLNTASGGFNLTSGSLTTNTFFQNTGSGTIAISGGTLNVGGDFINSGAGAVNVSGGAVNVTGNFTNSGTGTLTFSAGATTVTVNFLSEGVTNLTGGTVSGSGAATSSFEVDNTFLLQNATLENFTVKNSSAITIQNGQLSNITLDGGITRTNGYYAYIGDGVVFGTATPTTLDYGSRLAFNGSNNPTFNTELIFGSNSGYLSFTNLTLTLGSNALVYGASGTIGYDPRYGPSGTLINNGTIDADVSGGYLQVYSPTFTNNGTLKANGGSLYIENSTWTNAGNLIATGNNSTVSSENAVSNTGTVRVDNGNTMQFSGGLTQAAGSTVADGNLNLGSSQTLALQGGLLAGNGTINGAVTNSGGTVRPGDLVGTLTIAGNYTQTAAGITEIDLGGRQQGVTYDLLNVNSLATLAGTLDVKLVNGFTPILGDTFNFLTYGSLSGSYDSVVSLDNGFGYDVAYSDGIGTLTVNEVVSSVPEASTLLTAALMLGMGGGLLVRRRRAAL